MPPNMPSAERDVDARLVTALVLAQFPDLAGRPLTLLTNGWDNTLMRLGDDLLVRLPRREAAARLIQHEQTWLPRLAGRLPLPVPTPVGCGRPSPDFPWAWSIVGYVPGVDAAHEPRLDTGDAARSLGAFLGALHDPAPPDAPRSPVRGVDLRTRDVRVRENLARVGEVLDVDAAHRVWSEARAADPWSGPPLWVHGDLHPANVLVHEARVVAVIDFGDLTAGDPATDLSVAWMLLPPADRSTFWQTYAAAGHRVDDHLVRRSRGWALSFAALLLSHSADNPTLYGVGQRTAAAVLESAGN